MLHSPMFIDVDCLLSCENGGTLDTELCLCDCPPRFTGQLCDSELQVVPSTSACYVKHHCSLYCTSHMKHCNCNCSFCNTVSCKYPLFLCEHAGGHVRMVE